MTTVYTRILDTWKSAGVTLAQSPGRELIQCRLRTIGREVASDFIEFYATVGGMANRETDANLWSCWDLETILQENKTYERQGLLFADWCINSHLYLVRRECPERSSVWVDFFSGDEPEKLSDSLTDFFERYLARDESTYIYFETP